MAKIRITQKQHNKILESISKEMISESNILKAKTYLKTLNEGRKEVMLGTAMILGTVIGKDMSNFNEVVATKATKNPKVMASIKSAFEDQDKLKELFDELTGVGLKKVEQLMMDNAHAVVDEYNRIAKENNMPLLDVDAINNLKGID